MVARGSGLAKGTLYLYFKTKEETALAVLKQEYISWFNDFHEALDRDLKNKSELATWITNSFKKRQRFLKLLALGCYWLEGRVSEEAITSYELETYEHFMKTSERLSLFLKLGVEACSLKLLKVHVCLVGSLAHGFQAPTVKKVIRDQKLKNFDTDYYEVLTFALEGIF